MRIRFACGLDSRSWAGFWKNYRVAVSAVRTIQYNNLLFYLLFIIYYIIFIIYYSSDSPSSLITESLSLSSLSSPSSSHRMSSSDPSKALIMQHFLKDLMIMLSRMAYHAADTHCATSEGAAHLIFPVSVNSRVGSEIQVRYCCLKLSLKGLLLDTSIGCNTDVIPPRMTSSVSILRSWFFMESVRCPLTASRTSTEVDLRWL